MGTIIIKNLSTVTDEAVMMVIANLISRKWEVAHSQAEAFGIKIKHQAGSSTYRVLDKEKTAHNAFAS